MRFYMLYKESPNKAKRKHEKRFSLLLWVVVKPRKLSAFCVRTQ